MITHLKNEKGQVAIFVALIFQVLFVLFAMSINIGLVVHDKINLQNAVDLSAYYGAQKQAEWMSVMAHQNYQIRQSWKLFAFRYRVLGGMGLLSPEHPARATNEDLADTKYGASDNATVCINFRPTWPSAPEDDNFCQVTNFSISAPPSGIDLLPVLGFDSLLEKLTNVTESFKVAFDERCKYQGGMNWLFAAQAKLAFRKDQTNRLETIYSEFKNLRKNDFTTLDGGKVKVGIENTLMKNLTKTNRDGIAEIAHYNSISNKDINAENFFNRNLIAPQMIYSDQVNTGDTCKAELRPSIIPPTEESSKEFLKTQVDNIDELYAWATYGEPTDVSELTHSTVGVEKNPWAMAYVAVKATSQPRQVFSPFGAVTLTAYAFAKPFGGRMGPWYTTQWSPGSVQSDGAEAVDSLLPPRADLLMNASPSNINSKNVPNYSRYPGDQLGLKSQLALSPFGKDNLKNLFQSAGMHLDHFTRVTNNFTDGGENDILTYDYKKNQAAPVRRFEIAAIAPDLFDVNYYSIIPNYSKSVLPKLTALKQNSGMFEGVVLRGDLGSHGMQSLKDVSDQFDAMSNPSTGLRSPNTYYYITKLSHIFTDWVEEQYNDYVTFPETYFGKCESYDTQFQEGPFTPNGCIVGGRTGYSVKIVSKDYLLRSDLKLGGGDTAGPILNPPPEDF